MGQLSARAALCFGGLDTYAQVWLNGALIIESDNMFVPQRGAVGDYLRVGRNELRIRLTSAWQRGRELEMQHGPPRPLCNGDSSRLFVRKAQYHYGWDWGPTLVTAGIWRGLRLELSDARTCANQHWRKSSACPDCRLRRSRGDARRLVVTA